MKGQRVGAPSGAAMISTVLAVPDWTDWAACRGSEKPDWAFGAASQQYAFIAVHCKDCPVLAECADFGVGHAGVWGGKTSAQRGERRTRVDAARCGTPSGYARHYRAGEAPCEPCRAAKAEDSRQRWNRTAGAGEPTDTGRCGTYGGYQRHRQRGEYACTPCMDAQRAYAASRRAG